MILTAVLGLPFNATLAEARKEFEKNKNSLPPNAVDEFEKTLQKAQVDS